MHSRPKNVVGINVVTTRIRTRALTELGRKFVITCICRIRHASAKSETSGIVPVFGSGILVDRSLVVFISTDKHHLLSCSHTPVFVCLIVQIYPVGGIKVLVIFNLLVETLAPSIRKLAVDITAHAKIQIVSFKARVFMSDFAPYSIIIEAGSEFTINVDCRLVLLRITAQHTHRPNCC